jgi:hypothetical protein
MKIKDIVNYLIYYQEWRHGYEWQLEYIDKPTHWRHIELKNNDYATN